MRTFIAIDIPLSHRTVQMLNGIRERLQDEEIRWVNFEKLHLTLFFLGETESDRVEAIGKVFQRSVSPMTPLEITLKGMGTFGPRHSPTVFLVGLENSLQLNSLHRVINETVAPLGFIPDNRGFNPHITLGRIKRIRNISCLRAEIERIGAEPIERIKVGRVTLYKSTLTPQGPIYTPLLVQNFEGNL